MTDYYNNVYKKRLNRYGLNYQQRVQNERERLFELYLLKATERVSFLYNNEQHDGVIEQYKQDETKLLKYLLTRRNLILPNGYLIDYNDTKYMIYYLEDTTAQGYNRYVLLRMTHFIEWKDREGDTRNAWIYLYGQEDNMLKDELRSRSRMDTLYNENLKLSFFITPLNKYINKDDYIEIANNVDKDIKEFFIVTGYDRVSTEGIEYVSIDPIYQYDTSEKPIKTKKDNPDDFFWLNGGDIV